MRRFTDLKMAEKEKKIIDAAIAIISEKGFSAASTSEIAQMAGVAEGTIFRYFKTKKDILRGILIHMVNAVSEPLILESFKKILYEEEPADLRSVIRAFLKDRFALLDAIYPMLRIVVTEAMYHEDIRQSLYEKIIAPALTIFKQFHAEMVAKGLVSNDVDPLVVALSVTGNLSAFFVNRKIFGAMIEPADFDQEMEKMVDMIMYGIAGGKAKA